MTPQDARGSDVLSSRIIRSDWQGSYVLAADEDAARAEAEAEGYELGEDVGWMAETGWDQDNYDSREEFERESGYTTWWSGVQAPVNDEQRKHVLRAWTARPL